MKFEPLTEAELKQLHPSVRNNPTFLTLHDQQQMTPDALDRLYPAFVPAWREAVRLMGEHTAEKEAYQNAAMSR